MFCLFTPFLSVFFVSQEEPSLIASNQHISELFIQCNKNSCCEHITGGVNIYLYGCVSLLAPESVVSLYVCCVHMCVFVCDIKSDHLQKKHIKCPTSVNLMSSCIKIYIKFLLVLRYQGLTCVDP